MAAPTPPIDDCDDEYVVNRHGEREPVNFGKISDRIRLLLGAAYGGRLKGVKRTDLEKEVISRFKNGISTLEIDDIIVQVCRAKSGAHPDYSTLAARILVNNLQRVIDAPFKDVYLNAAKNPKSRLSEGFLQLVATYGDAIEERIDLARDYLNVSFSVATLMRSYLLRDPDSQRIIELPQHMYMRVALALHCMRPSRPAQYRHVVETDADGVERVRRELVAPGEPPGGMPVDDERVMQYRLEQAFEAYDKLSLKHISHASPTIFNAGTRIPQYSSCFQAQVDDSLRDLYQTLLDTAMMSKTAGGVSIELGRMRAKGSLIRGSGGESSGLGPYAQLCDKSQRYANQGGNRPGAFAMYLPVHHADVFTFLEMPLFHGPRYERREDARFLKYALMIPDRFMRTLVRELELQARFVAGEVGLDWGPAEWYLFSPSDAPDLNEVFDGGRRDGERSGGGNDGSDGGSDEDGRSDCSDSSDSSDCSDGDNRYANAFSALYDHYVAEHLAGRIPATKTRPSAIMREVAKAISMTGNPYILFKDNINRQSNLTVPARLAAGAPAPGNPAPVVVEDVGRAVVSSNLCAEVTIPCRTREGRPDETLYSVCNLGAINLAKYVVRDVTAASGVRVDWVGIIDAAAMLAVNLDNIIDLNHVPADGCERSNRLFRAIGIGVMGLADVFMLHGLAFGDRRALQLDAAIHACIYYGATRQSVLLAATRGAFPAFPSSAAARGLLQPDLCVESGVLPADWADDVYEATDHVLSPAMWQALRERMRAKGLRNGYVTALMPTATSSNAIGVNECFEPYTALKYPRKTLAGEFTLMCPHLVELLQKSGQWRDDLAELLDASGGSVAAWDGSAGTPRLSPETRRVFRTAREIDQLELVAHCAARNPFVSQSQSFNTYWTNIELPRLLEVWIAGWRAGLKTGSYYCHSQPAAATHQSAVRRPAARADARTDDARADDARGDSCGGACSI